MLVGTVNRKTVCFLLVLLTVSLTFLGIRFPRSAGLSSSSSKPKPRPRAVIQNQIKTCKQVINDLSDGFATPTDPFNVAVQVTNRVLPAFSNITIPDTTVPNQYPSRAPPAVAV